jgi:hypothetical protein
MFVAAAILVPGRDFFMPRGGIAKKKQGLMALHDAQNLGKRTTAHLTPPGFTLTADHQS